MLCYYWMIRLCQNHRCDRLNGEGGAQEPAAREVFRHLLSFVLIWDILSWLGIQGLWLRI